jgi:protein TonB
MIPGGHVETGVVQSPRGKGSISWWWVAPCLLAIVALPFVWRPLWRLAGSMSLPDPAPVSSAPVPSRLGFSASHEGSDWRLVWNRDAILRLNAVGAMLTIRDGGADRLQFLSPQDLTAGSLFYVPRTSDLTFNLKLALPDGSDIEEQIRVLGATPDHAPQMAEVVQPRRLGSAARVEEAPPGSATPKAPVRQFQPPAARVAAGAKPLADAVLPDVNSPLLPPVRIPQTLPSVPPPDPPRPAAASTEAPSPASAQIAQPSANPPQVGPPAQPALVPVTRIDPSPVRSVPPTWPRNVARQSGMDVRIRVRIDARGRVVGADPVQRSVSNFAFVDAALSAARMWTFNPALENGKPVPSETVLTFKFTP